MIRKFIYTVLAIAVIVITVYKLKSNKEATQKRVFQYDREKPVLVNTMVVKHEQTAEEDFFPGSFESNRETRLSSEIQGKVNAVFVDQGSLVQKGEVLIQLDNSLLQLQLRSVEIQIEGLEKDVRRYTVLAGADAIQGVQLEKAVLALKSAKVQKETLLEQLGKTAIRAPFGGIVTAKLTEVGAFAVPGVPLLQITDISILRFTFNVPENQLFKFREGEICSVIPDVFPESVLAGKITMVGSKANPGNSYPVQVKLKNTDNRIIKSGMFGKVRWKNDRFTSQISIPASSLTGTGINPQVFLVKNGKALLHNIRISERRENQVVVSEGLADGDVIVVSGFINLFDNANVTIKETLQ